MMRDDSSIPAGLCKTICYSPDLGRTIYVMSDKLAKHVQDLVFQPLPYRVGKIFKGQNQFA